MPVHILPPTPENLARAAHLLQTGGLVAFPTETVYGLGASIHKPNALRKIFEVKGRPQTNPLIVHVSDIAMADSCVGVPWSEAALALAEKHWPGPLTLVMEKMFTVPDLVTAGGDTVGIRVPNHPVALELIRLAGVPLAAPSANRSEEISPTTAQHVADSLGPFVDDLWVIDGGPCAVGIESEVVDVTGDEPKVLRQGMLALEFVGVPHPGSATGLGVRDIIARSPGQRRRHYAPKKETLVVRSDDSKFSMRPTDGLLLLPESPAEAAALLYARAAPPRCRSCRDADRDRRAAERARMGRHSRPIDPGGDGSLTATIDQRKRNVSCMSFPSSRCTKSSRSMRARKISGFSDGIFR